MAFNAANAAANAIPPPSRRRAVIAASPRRRPAPPRVAVATSFLPHSNNKNNLSSRNTYIPANLITSFVHFLMR
jgi:hypothetical protein